MSVIVNMTMKKNHKIFASLGTRAVEQKLLKFEAIQVQNISSKISAG